MLKNKHDFLWVVSLILIFTLAIATVNPLGDFPLNDDWAYVEAARRLVVQHEWQPPGWASMTLITQSLWGAMACTISACSFEHLRFSTIFAGLLLLISSYVLFRILRASQFLAFVAATSIAFNPITFALTYTFMTDVLFEMLLVVSSIFCIIALKQKSFIDICLACLFITGATLCRQLALCLSIAFCISYLLVSAESLGRRLAKSAAPLLTSFVAFLIFEEWLRATGRLPPMYFESQTLKNVFRSSINAIGHISYYGIVVTMYLGVFCLPVALCVVSTHDKQLFSFQRGRRLPLVIASMVSILIVLFLVIVRHVKFGWPLSWDILNFMPLLWNILNRSGIGPLTLRDTFILGLNSAPEFPTSFWALITCASVIGVWLLVYQTACVLIKAWPFIMHKRVPFRLGVFIFSVVGLLSYFTPVLVFGLYDRYIAAIVPLACIMLVLQTRSCDKYTLSGTAGAFAICLGVAIFSVLTTHDYLSWNRARWQAIESLERSHVADASSLDGGFEYNGYRSFNPAYVVQPTKSWWWVADDKYMITFGPLPNMEIFRRYDYATYLPIATRFIYVLRRPE